MLQYPMGTGNPLSHLLLIGQKSHGQIAAFKRKETLNFCLMLWPRKCTWSCRDWSLSLKDLVSLYTNNVIGRADAETEAPSLWSHDAKSQLIGKDPDAGKD